MLVLIELKEDFKITKFPNRESLAKYIKNKPTLSHKEYIILNGEIEKAEGRHIYDGRSQ
jgi:hypothetical protein